MKAITVLISVVAAGWVASSPGNGQIVPYSFAKSPDHPSTWVAGASNIRQVLRWDDARQMLVADVRYSTRDWADSVHPTEDGDYTLSFPSVCLDRPSGTLEAGDVQSEKSARASLERMFTLVQRRNWTFIGTTAAFSPQSIQLFHPDGQGVFERDLERQIPPFSGGYLWQLGAHFYEKGRTDEILVIVWTAIFSLVTLTASRFDSRRDDNLEGDAGG